MSLLAGACAPRAKPVGYVGGTALAIAGVALTVASTSMDCQPENVLEVPGAVVCKSASVGGTMLGVLTLLAGAAILTAAVASPSAPEPAPPGATALLPAAPPAPAAAPPAGQEQDARWRALQPSPSPSAPSRSPLAFD